MPSQTARAAFDAARQHTRRVRILKFVVPSAAILGIAGFLAYAFYTPSPEAPVDPTPRGAVIDGGKIKMDAPHLTGFNKRQQAYDVTASSATQAVSAPGLIDLSRLKAVISMPDKSSSTLAAQTGKFDSAKELLKLNEAVTVKSTKGYSVDLTSATVDFKAGTVDSGQPVTINLANGRIRGGTLAIQSGGGVINLKNGVSSRFQRPTGSGRTAGSSTSQ